MTAREKIKKMIGDLPDEQLKFIDQIINSILNNKRIQPPTGSLGLKKTFNRENFYDDILISL